MVFIVEMARGDPFGSDAASFECGDKTWKGLLSLATAFGWKPKGTVADQHSARLSKDYDRIFKPDYEPEAWAYCKCLTDEDALNLAVALRRAAASIREGKVVVLERAGPVLMGDELTPEESRQINLLPTEILEDFASFAEGGGFAFAWDD